MGISRSNTCAYQPLLLWRRVYRPARRHQGRSLVFAQKSFSSYYTGHPAGFAKHGLHVALD